MLHASYIKDSSIYEVRLIDTEDSIDSDVDTVRHVIAGTDEALYKENMRISIRQNLAFDLWKDGVRKGFVYNKTSKDGKYLGCSIWIRDISCMVLALKTMFEICDKPNIRFYPHTDNIRDFLSMATGTSIRKHYMSGDAVVFDRKILSEKGYEIFQYLGFNYGWCNIWVV